MNSRIISGIVAAGYLIAAYFGGGAILVWRVALFLILPLACIWFSDSMGGYTGSNFGVRPAITHATPGCFVAFGGWLVLLMPVILMVIYFIGYR